MALHRQLPRVSASFSTAKKQNPVKRKITAVQVREVAVGKCRIERVRKGRCICD